MPIHAAQMARDIEAGGVRRSAGGDDSGRNGADSCAEQSDLRPVLAVTGKRGALQTRRRPDAARRGSADSPDLELPGTSSDARAVQAWVHCARHEPAI